MHGACEGYGNFAILLYLMQHVTGYLLTSKDLDFFKVSLDINGQLRLKRKIHDSTYSLHDIDVTRGKTLPDFIMSSLLLSKTDIGLKLFFRS